MMQEIKFNAIRIALDIISNKSKNNNKDIQEIADEVINNSVNQDSINKYPIQKIEFDINLINNITEEHITEYGDEICKAFAKSLTNNAIHELNEVNNYVRSLYDKAKNSYNDVVELSNNVTNAVKENNKRKEDNAIYKYL